MKLKVFLVVMVFWLTIGTIFMLSLYLDALKYQTGFEVSPAMIGATAVVYISWSMLTFALYKFLQQPVVLGQVWRCAVIFVVGLAVALPVVTILDYSVYNVLLGNGFPDLKTVVDNTRFVYTFFNVIIYMVVYFVCAGFIYQQYSQKMKLESVELLNKHTQAQLNLVDMKMQALQSQLSPHFLFNCLNSISALTRKAEKNQVIRAIARLGDLLRFSVSASKSLYISVLEEIEFTDHYVVLQKLRFGEQIVYNLRCEDAIKSKLCPPFILHTLVENAFTHTTVDPQFLLKIEVDIQALGDCLSIKVNNTLPKGSPSEPPHQGLGLAIDNLQTRLNILYPDNFSVTRKRHQDHYFAEARIPIKVSHDE